MRKFLFERGKVMSIEKLCCISSLILDETLTWSSIQDLKTTETERDMIPVGSVEFVVTFAKKHNIQIHHHDCYPAALTNFLGRDVSITKFKHANKDWFVKPIEVKQFTGNIKSRVENHEKYEDLFVYTSPPICFKNEYRCYIHNGKCIGISRYDSFEDNADQNERERDRVLCFLDEILKTYSQDAKTAIGYSVDIGFVNDTPLLVEINDGWSLGYYQGGTCSRLNYVSLIVDRWHEILNASN